METSSLPRPVPVETVPFSRQDIEQTIPTRFEHVVRRLPDAVALTGGGRRWTYADLNARANQIAHVIRAEAKPGSGCVAYLSEHAPEMVIATLAVLKAGKTYLAIHPGAPPDRQADIVRSVNPELVLTTESLGSRAVGLAQRVGCPVVVLDEVRGGPVADPPGTDVLPQHPSTLFYTSGSTGQPKGVVKSHRAVLHRVWLAAHHDGVGPGDRQSLLTHCAFSASESDMFGALLNGATLSVFDFASEGLGALCEWLDRDEITLFHPPVLLFRRLLATLSATGCFPSVRLVALAGEVVVPADVEAWRRHFSPGSVLMHRFSATETGLLSLARITADSNGDLGSLPPGRPVEDKTLELVDLDGHPVSGTDSGELVVKSRYIAEGYWRPGEAIAMFPTDPADPSRRVYRTGDRGRFTADGGFEFLGRADRQVKIRGYRVELAEVEGALARHPEVAEAVVEVYERPPMDKQLVAYVVPRANAPTAVAIRAFLRDALPMYMIPARIVLLESLPLTPTGKVDRAALPPPDLNRPAAEHHEPRTDLERQLAVLWEELLVVDRVSIRDSFFDLGGHSLVAAQLFARIEAALGVRLPLATLLQSPTIEDLAAVIGNRKAKPGWRSLVAIQPLGTRPRIFGLRGAGGNVVGYHALSELLGTDQPFYGLQSRGLGGDEEPFTDFDKIVSSCLGEVREVQPHGPYHLMGACMGAVVAWEMAQRLCAAGEQVDLLALVEPRPPARSVRAAAIVIPPRPVTVLRVIRNRLRSYWQTFTQLRGRERLGFLKSRLTIAKEIITKRDLFRGSRTELNLAVVRRANKTAVHRYKPEAYPGSVVLFLAEGRTPASGRDPRLGWQDLARGGTEVYYVPGDDSGLALARPNVDVLAPLLKGCIDRAAETARRRVVAT